MELFSVMAKLLLDKGEFDQDVKEADSQGKNLAERLSGYMDKAKKMLTAIGIGAAVGKAAKSIWNLANETAAAGDRIDKTSQSLGMSRQAFQEWDYILSQSGASIDSMGMTMKTLGAAISENSGETASALAQLGLSAAYLQSISPEKQFEMMVRQFQTMPASAQKSQLALQLFGRNAQSLMPLLNSSTDSIDELRAAAERLGLIMSDEDVDAAVQFGDALDDLQRSWNSFKYKIGAQLLPGFTTAFQNIAASVGNISTALVGALKTGDFGAFFSTITTEIERLIPGIVDRTVGFIEGVFQNADKLVGIAVAIITGIGNGLIDAAPMLIEKLPDIFNTIWEGAQSLAENLGNLIIGAINGALGTDVPEVSVLVNAEPEEWFTWLKELIDKTSEALVHFTVEHIDEWIQTINKWISDAQTAIINLVAPVVGEWLKKVGNWIDNTQSVFINLVEMTVGDWIVKIADWIDNTKTATVNFLTSSVSGWIVKIANWIENAKDATVNFITNTVSQWITDLSAWVGNAKDATVNFLTNTVSDWIVKVADWVDNAKNATVNFLTDTVSDWISKIAGWIESAKNAVLNFSTDTVSDWIDTLSSWAGNAKNAILNFGTKTVALWIKTIAGWVDKTLETTLNFAGGAANDLFGTVKGWIDAGASAVITFGGQLSGWAQTIYNWIRNGVSVSVNFVGSMVEGVSNAVGSAVSTVGSTMSGIGSMLVNGWNSALGMLGIPHAKGLNYVPYDEYPALLHRGETVLNQDQGRKWREGKNSGFDAGQLYGAVANAVANAVADIQINMDGNLVGNAVTNRVSRNMYQKQMGRRFAT